jgi:integrase
MATILLTPELVLNGLTVPPGKTRIEYCDLHPDARSLYIDVSASNPGHGVYRVRQKIDGKTTHFVIGKTSEVTLQSARQQTVALKSQLAAGVNPKATQEKSKKADGITLHDFFYDHFKPLQQPRLRSWDRYEELFRLRIDAEFGQQKLTEITRHAFSGFLAKLLASGLSASSTNHHGKLARRVLNVACDLGMLDKNPLSRLPLYAENNVKDSFLDGKQLAALLATLKADGGQVAKLGRLLLATGARSGEARLAKWTDIRRDEGLWVVPAANSKSKKNRAIPLNPSAVELLNELDTEGKYEYLFVQRRSRSGKGLPLSASIGKAWGKLCAKAGITGYTPHSNRHQMASLMVQGGCTLYEVQHVLGHASPTVTQRYAHLSTKSLAAASNTASLAIQRAMGAPAMAAAPAVPA